MAGTTLGNSEAQGCFRLQLRETLLAYFLIFPATLITLIFGIYPVLAGVWESFKAGSPTPNQYVGLDQYLRGIGSLIYIVIFILAVLFCSFAYRAWQRIRQEPQSALQEQAWLYLIPGFVLSLGVFITLTVFVTKGYRFNIEALNISIIWIGVALIMLGFAGYYFLAKSTPGKKTTYILNTWLIMQLTLLSVLMVRYTYGEIQGDVEDARQIAALVLNSRVSNAEPLVTVEGAQFGAVEIGEVPVRVQIGDHVYDAMLDPTHYSQVPIGAVNTTSTLSFGNQQNVQVVLPLERGFGLEPITLRTQAQLVIERDASQIGQVGSGPPTLEVPVTVDTNVVQAPNDILFAGDIGTEVIDRGGYTTPVQRPFLAAIGVVFCLGTLVVSSQARRPAATEEADWNLWMRIGRFVLWVVIAGLVLYIIAQVEFYRSAAISMQKLSQDEFEAAYQYASGAAVPRGLFRNNVAQDLMFFPQIISISAGALLIITAYFIWTGARTRETPMGMGASILLATCLMVGGWLCIAELPSTITLAGQDAIDARDALIRTALYSLGTVPTQLALGMLLAYLMFYEVTTGKGIFRLIYFMPYITPQIATATVFTVIFSIRESSLANQFLNLFGISDQRWLKEGNGIFRIFYNEVLNGNPAHIPDLFQGPSLALATVILFNIWVYSGYNSVIFLAGLGAIPGELYEAARVDGAGRWAAFRHITFPLLSPVTFFLSILSIIGTFKAFGSVYVIRDQDNNYADTFTVTIFQALNFKHNNGYAAALAFVLFAVIMVLTLAQNRLSRERVFYG